MLQTCEIWWNSNVFEYQNTMFYSNGNCEAFVEFTSDWGSVDQFQFMKVTNVRNHFVSDITAPKLKSLSLAAEVALALLSSISLNIYCILLLLSFLKVLSHKILLKV